MCPGLLGLVAAKAHAEPLPFDCRRGEEMSPAGGAPAEGWAHAADGDLPGKAGNPCWLRIDMSRLAPKVLSIKGGAGRKAVRLFDANGGPLADARGLGARHQVIVGAAEGWGSMLFPTLTGHAGIVYARVDRFKYQVKLEAVDLADAIQADRNHQFLNFGLAVAYALFALLAALLAVVNRDRGLWVFALYFGMLTAGGLVQNSVALVDVQTPEMDGLEAARRITTQWPTAERPRIVAMTANAMRDDREECLAAGMDDYITKPIRVDALVQALQSAAWRGEG